MAMGDMAGAAGPLGLDLGTGSGAKRRGILLMNRTIVILLVRHPSRPVAAARKNRRALRHHPVTVTKAQQKEVTEWDEYFGRLATVDEGEVCALVSGYEPVSGAILSTSVVALKNFLLMDEPTSALDPGMTGESAHRLAHDPGNCLSQISLFSPWICRSEARHLESIYFKDGQIGKEGDQLLSSIRALAHIGLVGDTYMVLLSGDDTNGRDGLIDMCIPPGGGAPQRHISKSSFTILEGERTGYASNSSDCENPIRDSG
jgi:hypothetical protein